VIKTYIINKINKNYKVGNISGRKKNYFLAKKCKTLSPPLFFLPAATVSYSQSISAICSASPKKGETAYGSLLISQ
jgi:hypothetical protein